MKVLASDESGGFFYNFLFLKIVTRVEPSVPRGSQLSACVLESVHASFATSRGDSRPNYLLSSSPLLLYG